MIENKTSEPQPLPHTDEQQIREALEQAGLLTGRVWQALAIARLAHHAQQRFDGTSYLDQHVYPVAVQIVSHTDEDRESGVIIALLHDVLEDCPTIACRDLEAVVGSSIAGDVVTLTKPWAREKSMHAVTERERELRESEYFARIERARRVVRLVKVFDRLNNLACVHQRPLWKQVEYIMETRRFHLRLANEIDPALGAQMERVLASLRSAICASLE